MMEHEHGRVRHRGQGAAGGDGGAEVTIKNAGLEHLHMGMTEKFVGYFRFVEACARPGCPLCRCLDAESRRYLEALLYEQVTDLDTRQAIRRSWGFCNRHTWMLPEIGTASLGTAIIWDDLVRRMLRAPELRRRAWLPALRRRRPRFVDLWRRRETCPACAEAATTEARYLETLLTFADDEDLRTAYAFSDGLCMPHLVLAVERGGEHTEALIESTRQAWARIGRDLAAFVGKHDHRNREPYTEAEATATARAFEMLAGARGVTVPSAR
jgi:hypothetical protein